MRNLKLKEVSIYVNNRKPNFLSMVWVIDLLQVNVVSVSKKFQIWEKKPSCTVGENVN
jgi:hypothetical protein